MKPDHRAKIIMRSTLALSLGVALLAVPLQSSAISTLSSVSRNSATNAWKHLGPRHRIYPYGETAGYYRWRLNNGSTANLVVVDLSLGQWKLRTVSNGALANAAVTATKYGASIAVNGGFFDTRTGDSVGFVIDDRQTKASPHRAKNLVGNKSCHALLPAILNRSELRQIVDQCGSSTLSISPHACPVANGATILESLQAGPMLVPHYDPAQEAFIRKDAKGRLLDSISTTAARARTAAGITADGRIMLLAVDDPAKGADKAGLTLPQLALLFKQLGAVQALNLDGGTSTTMYLRLEGGASQGGVVVCGGRRLRRVQSVLLLQPVSWPKASLISEAKPTA